MNGYTEKVQLLWIFIRKGPNPRWTKPKIPEGMGFPFLKGVVNFSHQGSLYYLLEQLSLPHKSKKRKGGQEPCFALKLTHSFRIQTYSSSD